jgi:hypothetical protein
VTIVSKEAGFEQRVLIEGASMGNGAHPGVPGEAFDVDGDLWTLRIQHDDGTGFADSEHRPGPLEENGAQLSQTVESEDLPGPGGDFNDLIVRVDKTGPMFSVDTRPFAASPETLEMFPDGIFVGVNGVQLMGVRVTNTWGRVFHADTFVRIATLGRMALTAHGIDVVDAWSPDELTATGQQMTVIGARVGSLEVGESRTIFFKVDAAGARTGKPDVRFQLLRLAGVPDAASPARHSSHPVFVAELGYDPVSRTVSVTVPEGRAEVRLHAVVADRRAFTRVCRAVATRSPEDLDRLAALVGSVHGGRCDDTTVRELIRLLCRCLAGCGGHGGDLPGLDMCTSRFLWLPADVEYTVTTDGYEGQFGPLPFQDPWWKVLLIILAALLAIAAAVVEATGWGRPSPSRRIGQVGRFSTTNVDAALIALNGERAITTSVADAISGEPNQNPAVALDAVIPIDSEPVAPFVDMRVIKSGARTGFTHGIVTSTTATTNQCRGVWDDATQTCQDDPARPNLLMTNQVRVGVDATFGEEPSDAGDSGSLWLSDEPDTRFRVVGLNHSGAGSQADANPIADVLTAMNITFEPGP